MIKSKVEKELVGLVVQARMGSSRLPGKVMKNLCGEPLLGFLLKRLQGCDIDGARLIVATTDREEDHVIVDYCRELSVLCVQGSEQNVFDRFKKVAKVANLSHAVRLTADNPLIDERVLKKAVAEHLQTKADFSSTRKMENERVTERYTPKGHSVDIINCKLFPHIDSSKLTPFEQEHVIPFFYNGNFDVNYIVPCLEDLVETTVDTLDEFEKVATLIHDGKGHF